jgi:hypothetical protein
LLQERRQYEAWLARIDAATDTTPEHVRSRVRGDYIARLAAVTEELKAHADAARQLIAQKKESLTDLAKKEKLAAERLAETELRHSVGEYDESQWAEVHRDVLALLVGVRQELEATQQDIDRLEELDRLVRAKPAAAAPGARAGAAPKPGDRKAPLDELAFLKSVTEDDRTGPSAKRASGAHFQPAVPDAARPGASPAPRAAGAGDDPDEDGPKTLKCAECGTMNMPTEWYCEHCGAELAAL